MSGRKHFKDLSDELRSTPESRAAVEQEKQIIRDILALHRARRHTGRAR